MKLTKNIVFERQCWSCPNNRPCNCCLNTLVCMGYILCCPCFLCLAGAFFIGDENTRETCCEEKLSQFKKLSVCLKNYREKMIANQRFAKRLVTCTMLKIWVNGTISVVSYVTATENAKKNKDFLHLKTFYSLLVTVKPIIMQIVKVNKGKLITIFHL